MFAIGNSYNRIYIRISMVQIIHALKSIRSTHSHARNLHSLNCISQQFGILFYSILILFADATKFSSSHFFFSRNHLFSKKNTPFLLLWTNFFSSFSSTACKIFCCCNFFLLSLFALPSRPFSFCRPCESVRAVPISHYFVWLAVFYFCAYCRRFFVVCVCASSYRMALFVWYCVKVVRKGQRASKVKLKLTKNGIK